MQSHYRKSLVFSYENLDNAAVAYNKLAAKVATLFDNSAVDKAAFDNLKANFTEAMDNDLNTALAVTAVYDVLKADTTNATKLALIEDFDKVLGIGLIDAAKKLAESNSNAGDDIPEEITKLIEERKEARKAKNFALADEIRDKIAEMGYVITETREGTKVTKK